MQSRHARRRSSCSALASCNSRLATVRRGEINRDSRRAGQSLESLREIVSADGRRPASHSIPGREARPATAISRAVIELNSSSRIRSAADLLVDAVPCELVGLDFERHVGLDPHQSSARGPPPRDAQRAVPRLSSRRESRSPRSGRGSRRVASIAAEFLNQRRRRLFADARHAFDIVDRVARQRLDIDQRRRLDAEALAHLARADAPIAHRVPQRHVRPDQLHEVLVRRDERDDEVFFRRALGERADHVVGLEALDHQRLDPKRLDRAMDIRNLHDQIVRRLAAVGLVIGEQVVAKSSLRRVEDDRDMRRAHVLQQLQQHPDEAVHRLGRQPARGVHRRQRMKRAKDVPGAIDQNQLLAFSGHQLETIRYSSQSNSIEKQTEALCPTPDRRIDSLAWHV